MASDKTPWTLGNRVLPVNAPIAELWGAMAAEAQRNGVALAIIDGLMAATAIHHSLDIVTRNVKDWHSQN